MELVQTMRYFNHVCGRLRCVVALNERETTAALQKRAVREHQGLEDALMDITGHNLDLVNIIDMPYVWFRWNDYCLEIYNIQASIVLT